MQQNCRKCNTAEPSVQQYSMARRFTITLILAVSMVSLVTITAIYFYVVSQHEHELNRLADEDMSYLTGSLEIPIWNVDKTTVRMIGEAVAQNENIASLQIADTYGSIRYTLGPENTRDHLQRSATIIHNGEPIGTIKLSMTGKFFAEKRRDLIFFLFLTTTIVVLLLMVFTGILVRKFIRTPLLSFNTIVASFADGRYDTKMLSQPYTELKPLENVLSLMSKKIKQQFFDLNEAKEELYRANHELEERVRQRTKELAVAKEQAEAVSRFKSEFLARMSHEIRTPMNAIIGLTNLALKTEINEKQKDLLFKTYESSHHLLRIINDILDFSKIEAGRLELAVTDFMLHHVIDRMANMFRIRAAEKHIEIFYMIDKNVPLALKGDPLRLGQVLINLISNAIKFTQKGHIIVRVTLNPEKAAAQAKPDQVCLLFSVQDSGMGIAPERQADLFEPFIQLDGSMTRNFEGTGLGLSICHHLVTMMGGQIWLQSELGRGSTFFFTLVSDLQPEPERRTLTSPEDIKGLNILVVDDNPAARQILQEILQSFDMQVNTAVTGEQALIELNRAAPVKPYDLVVLDWKMQPIDGFKLAGQIHKDPELKKSALSPKIIMATMYARDEIGQTKQSGVEEIDAFLFKPISSSEIFNTIMMLFGKEEAIVPRMVFNHDAGEIAGIECISGARLLLVEDNDINQQVAMAHLQRGGLIVDVAENGQTAVELVQNARPPYDLVLMDIEMPVMDGFTATRKIRELEKSRASSAGQPHHGKQEQKPGIPIIAMTAHALEGDKEKCLAAGMNDYIPKPVEEREMFAVLIKWIKPETRNLQVIGRTGQKFAEAPWDTMPEQIAGLNLETALQRIHGNSGLYQRMLNNFLDEFETAGNRVKEYLETGRFQDACRLTHALRGVCTNIGALALYRAVRDLDDGIRTDKKENLPGLLTAFLSEFSKVTSALKAVDLEPDSASFVEALPSAAPDPSSKPEIIRIIQDMQILLKENNSRALNALSELKNALAGGQFRDELNQIDRTLYKLNFKKAAAILVRISTALNIDKRKENQ